MLDKVVVATDDVVSDRVEVDSSESKDESTDGKKDIEKGILASNVVLFGIPLFVEPAEFAVFGGSGWFWFGC